MGTALAGSAWASSHEEHSGHGAHGKTKYSEAVAAKAHPKLVAAADACTRTGRICFSHCLETFRVGDTTMADCTWSVGQMMHVCEAFPNAAEHLDRHARSSRWWRPAHWSRDGASHPCERCWEQACPVRHTHGLFVTEWGTRPHDFAPRAPLAARSFHAFCRGFAHARWSQKRFRVF